MAQDWLAEAHQTHRKASYQGDGVVYDVMVRHGTAPCGGKHDERREIHRCYGKSHAAPSPWVVSDIRLALYARRGPCHTARRCQTTFRDKGVRVLDWPGNSPDMNPIETLWAIMKQRLRSQTITNKKELIGALIKIWVRDVAVTVTCQRLIASMPERISALIAAKGGHTKYWPYVTNNVLNNFVDCCELCVSVKNIFMWILSIYTLSDYTKNHRAYD